MAFQRFESRFCAFEGPAEWRVVPGLGMVDDSDGNLDRSVVVMENWVDPPQNASDYLETQKEMLGQEKPETEVIGEQTLDSRQLSEGVLVTFRTPFPGGGGALLQKQLVAVEGPLVCTLTVSGLEDDTTLWNELCNPLLGSFTVPALLSSTRAPPNSLITSSRKVRTALSMSAPPFESISDPSTWR